LKDQWLTFAREGHVAAWTNVPRPQDRLSFWTHPELEIDLASKANVQIFRMGVDWTRLYPERGQFNATAMQRYVEIVKQVREAGMKVMMTLFHHSIPAWTNAIGGWTNESLLEDFSDFSINVAHYLGDMVDFWTTFNEPHVFVSFVHCAGMWPPGPQKDVIHEVACLAPGGDFGKAMSLMARAHNEFAKYCRQSGVKGKIGFAYNVANYVPQHVWDRPAVMALEASTKFIFVDAVQDNMDFIGLNYYGREIISGTAPVITEDMEYSESGRCVDPAGLYKVLKQFWDRYPGKAEGIFITENGISDDTDILRPSYITEHLAAVGQLIKDGVPVLGYVHWTTSDNWEWVDGYCPKFGLAAVNRSAPGMPRIPRPSFALYSDIAAKGMVTDAQRSTSWSLITSAVARNATRPFCRGDDGVASLDVPVQRKISGRDWRFKAQDAIVVV
jgi:beta-glucosidase/6-phospho-beta-glucosidase/beta-galactosidase